LNFASQYRPDRRFRPLKTAFRPKKSPGRNTFDLPAKKIDAVERPICHLLKLTDEKPR
jgi:hypothetical protein